LGLTIDASEVTVGGQSYLYQERERGGRTRHTSTDINPSGREGDSITDPAPNVHNSKIDTGEIFFWRELGQGG
jgi:hypothetical protein